MVFSVPNTADAWAGAPPSPRFESDKEDGEDIREPIAPEMFSHTFIICRVSVVCRGACSLLSLLWCCVNPLCGLPSLILDRALWRRIPRAASLSSTESMPQQSATWLRQRNTTIQDSGKAWFNPNEKLESLGQSTLKRYLMNITEITVIQSQLLPKCILPPPSQAPSCPVPRWRRGRWQADAWWTQGGWFVDVVLGSHWPSCVSELA